jgi:leader peptidase (prepilin peptidase)/N-methyltransferase
MSIIFFFLFGIIIGSFLNVVICRLQKEETLMGRSHCTKCEQQIAWYDNVPLLSFVILRGKCRQCEEKISWQYPVVEFATGIVFALTGWLVFSVADTESFLPTIFYLGLFAMLIVIFVYDLLTMYIPMTVMWMAIGWSSVYLIVSQWLLIGAYPSLMLGDILPFVVSGLGAFLFFWLLVWVSNETWMGMGDAYLALLMGLAVGWPGILWAMTLSFGMGAFAGITLIVLGKKVMKSQVPFAPFMALGIVLTVMLPLMFPELQFLMILY